jgi:hypothetical protein
METNPLHRRVTFGLMVLVLVGLGVYLIGPAAHGSPKSGGAPAHPRHPAGQSPPPSVPSPAAQPAATGAPDIYQWLPFTPAGLNAAAAVTTEFGVAYGTFSYTQTAAAYAATLQRFASPQLVAQVKAAFGLPGVAAARTSARQVSAGRAVIQSLRAFGPTSITFVIQVTEDLTAESGPSQLATTYAVTLTGSGTAWQVTDIELASAGNS